MFHTDYHRTKYISKKSDKITHSKNIGIIRVNYVDVNIEKCVMCDRYAHHKGKKYHKKVTDHISHIHFSDALKYGI